jgi:cell wall-associated NlpC family hydrolase
MLPRLRRPLPAFLLVAAGVAVLAVVSFARPSGAEARAHVRAASVPDLPPRPVTEPPDPPTRGERAARVALRAVGIPYRWGGESPVSGFDCSGLVRWAYLQVGVDLPHSSYALFGEGRRVPQRGMETGDLLFFEGLGHVGLYLGRGRMVHAPQTGRTVEVVRLAGSNYGARLIGARRVAPA